MSQINKTMKMVKDQFFMLALLAMVIGFSAFNYTNNQSLDTITLYFHGEPDVQEEVESAFLWTDESNSETCGGSQLACEMEVHPDDVIAVGSKLELDPNRVTIQALQTSSGYTPEKAPESTSPHDISPSNRN